MYSTMLQMLTSSLGFLIADVDIQFPLSNFCFPIFLIALLRMSTSDLSDSIADVNIWYTSLKSWLHMSRFWM